MVLKQQAPSKVKEPIIVSESDLPLCCPTPQTALWNTHPRVYLPIDKTGSETCPYCATRYVYEKVS